MAGALYLKDWHLVDACRSLGLEVRGTENDFKVRGCFKSYARSRAQFCVAILG